MTDNDIKLFFDVYFNNFITSISWDEQIHAPATKEEWIGCLKNCGRSRYQLCVEDDLLFRSFFTHLKEDTPALSNSQFDLILSYCRKLYYSQYNEPSLLLRFAEELIPHYKANKDIESLIFLYTCAGYSALQLSRTGDHEIGLRSSDYYKKVVALRDEIDTFQVPASRDYIFIAYDNLIRVEPFLHNLPIEEAYQFFLELLDLRKQEKFCRYDTVNPRIPKIVNKTINNFISCENELLLFDIEFPDSLRLHLFDLTKEHYIEVLKRKGSIYGCPPSLVFQYYRLMAEEDAISWDEAYSIVDDYYTRKNEMIPDETELDYLSFYVDLPILLMYFLSHTTLSANEKDHRNLTYRSMVIRFLSTRHYRLHTYSQYDGMRMACFHPIVLDTFHHPVEKTNFILDLIVSSHLATLTHSVMVSYLAEALLKYILDDKPEILLCPALGTTVSEIQKNRSHIIDFAVQGSMLHDIGKNGIVPIINTQHRKLTDYEFYLIRMHPETGAKDLASMPDFACYADIAHGHHRTYDGTGGYPDDFDIIHSPCRPIIDLVHICDCLDAATDYLSRNYHNAKDFDTVLKELADGSGTQYNPDIINLILTHSDLRKELASLVGPNRENIYYDVYRTFANKR